MILPLTEKYRAKTFSEIKGQENAIQEIKAFLKMFPRKKAIILNGPVGTGKTSMAIALANEYNLELFELNASDLRNRSKLDEILKPATNQQSLFKTGKIILMDEADGITTNDRGGLPELLVLIEKSSFPIIITANDIWQKKFSLLRQKCPIINLKEIKEELIYEILIDITKKENKNIPIEIITLIAKKAKGDLRAALNDLQSFLTLEILEHAMPKLDFLEKPHLDIGEREKTESIFDSLKKLFQNQTDQDTINIFDSADLEIDEIALWIEENIPSEYQGKALAKAYNYLSKADIFKGRIYRQQYWRFLFYQNFFLTAGISSVTKIKNKKFISYKRPSRILKIWLANQKNAKKKAIINKYSSLTHMSTKKANRDSFLLPLILDKKAQEEMDLDEKEKDYLQDKRGAIIIANNLNRFR